eukprot:gene5873-6114_t
MQYFSLLFCLKLKFSQGLQWPLFDQLLIDCSCSTGWNVLKYAKDYSEYAVDLSMRAAGQSIIQARFRMNPSRAGIYRHQAAENRPRGQEWASAATPPKPTNVRFDNAAKAASLVNKTTSKEVVVEVVVGSRGVDTGKSAGPVEDELKSGKGRGKLLRLLRKAAKAVTVVAGVCVLLKHGAGAARLNV